jgi:hypothetical protein
MKKKQFFWDPTVGSFLRVLGECVVKFLEASTVHIVRLFI